MMCKKVCSNCGRPTHKALQLCKNCYEYQRRYGRPRPPYAYKNDKIEFCNHCKIRTAEIAGLCLPCYRYERRTGRKRPRYLIERHCLNCGNPRIHAKGMCLACYRYKQRTGKPRPKRLHLRYCDCGNVASRRLRTPHGDIDVCEPCYQLEQSYSAGNGAPQVGTFDSRRMDYHT